MLDTQYSFRAKDVGTRHYATAAQLREAMKSYVPSDLEFEFSFAMARVSRAYQARYYLRALENATKQIDDLTRIRPERERCRHNA